MTAHTKQIGSRSVRAENDISERNEKSPHIPYLLLANWRLSSLRLTRSFRICLQIMYKYYAEFRSNNTKMLN